MVPTQTSRRQLNRPQAAEPQPHLALPEQDEHQRDADGHAAYHLSGAGVVVQVPIDKWVDTQV